MTVSETIKVAESGRDAKLSLVFVCRVGTLFIFFIQGS